MNQPTRYVIRPFYSHDGSGPRVLQQPNGWDVWEVTATREVIVSPCDTEEAAETEAALLRAALPPEPQPEPTLPRQQGQLSDALAHQLAAMVKAGQSSAAMAAALNLSANTIVAYVSRARKQLGVEAVPYRPAGRKRDAGPARVRKGFAKRLSDDLLQQAAALWREGRTSTQIEAALGHCGGTLVSVARARFGVAKVPRRLGGRYAVAQPKVTANPAAPISMASLGKHYVRKAGRADEYLFRNANGSEEVWVRSDAPGAIMWRGHVRIAFKEALVPLCGRARTATSS